ncbi:MAG TPA: hypothetical protein VK737_09465 [Opitutales bacterium]|jgi:hypothetical protein|nr:hypothetical protein [Opitutales bacterium]
MAKRIAKKPFDEHLENLRDARRQTEEAIHMLGGTHKHANQVMAIIWQMVFEDLTERKKQKPELEAINTFSGVIYRLAQSAHRLKTLEHETREYEEQLRKHREAAAQAREALANHPGLPEKEREVLERELNIMS